jgi:hypothetical protein
MKKCTRINKKNKDKKIQKNMYSKKKAQCLIRMDKSDNAMKENLNFL